MSKSSRVSFSLAPLVHLYKRRVPLSEPSSPVQSPVFECVTPTAKNVIVQESNHEPKPTLNLSSCCFEQFKAEPSPLPPQPPPPLNLFSVGLSISVPKHETPTEQPDYDVPPLSPSAHHEFRMQRAHEKEACATALSQALAHFHLSVTPPWQRTPASVRTPAKSPSMSPLNLTPRPELPPLPMSPENSFMGLDTLAPN